MKAMARTVISFLLATPRRIHASFGSALKNAMLALRTCPNSSASPASVPMPELEIVTVLVAGFAPPTVALNERLAGDSVMTGPVGGTVLGYYDATDSTYHTATVDNFILERN